MLRRANTFLRWRETDSNDMQNVVSSRRIETQWMLMVVLLRHLRKAKNRVQEAWTPLEKMVRKEEEKVEAVLLHAARPV